MSNGRASIFEDDDLDLSAFAPRPKDTPTPVNKEAIRKVAETRGFQSREPGIKSAQAPVSDPLSSPRMATKAIVPQARPPRRYVTGRNRQLNLKVTEAAADRFYALADANHWVLGEAFELAIEALEQQLNPPEDARKS